MNIAFVDFWQNFNPYNNFFVHYFKNLVQDTNIEINIVSNPQNADISICNNYCYSQYGKDHCGLNSLKTIKIFYTGEPYGIETPEPNVDEYDYIFSFEHGNKEKNIRIPLWYLYINWFSKEMENGPSYLLPVNELEQKSSKWFNVKKDKDCCAVFSNPKQERFDIIQALSKHIKIDCFGKPFNNSMSDHGGDNKYKKISEYKSSMCFENKIQSGYVTEKLLQSRVCGNLAIYWGHSDVKEDFNPEGFVNAADFKTFDECAEYVCYILQDENKYNEMVNKPIFSSSFFKFDEKVKSILTSKG